MGENMSNKKEEQRMLIFVLGPFRQLDEVDGNN